MPKTKLCKITSVYAVFWMNIGIHMFCGLNLLVFFLLLNVPRHVNDALVVDYPITIF